jgi:hypothetical protein
MEQIRRLVDRVVNAGQGGSGKALPSAGGVSKGAAQGARGTARAGGGPQQ